MKLQTLKNWREDMMAMMAAMDVWMVDATLPTTDKLNLKMARDQAAECINRLTIIQQAAEMALGFWTPPAAKSWTEVETPEMRRERRNLGQPQP